MTTESMLSATPGTETISKPQEAPSSSNTGQDQTKSNNQNHAGKSKNRRQKRHQNNHNINPRPQASSETTPVSTVTSKDENLPPNLQPDPRGHQKLTKKATHRGTGRNTDSFDPDSTLVRPDLRIRVGLEDGLPLKHDDVVIVPQLFGPTNDWSNYYKLIREITDLQEQQQQQYSSNPKKKGAASSANFVSWHEGAHLIVKNPEESPTFQAILDRMCEYFHIDRSSAGYRFNFYTDSKDWKPFHHDSAAFNPQRAKNQNITVGVSFGATRELAFLRAYDQDGSSSVDHDQHRVRVYFPQPNNGVFSFGRDVNIHWKHGVNALEPELQDGKGRISIILWGKALNVVEEEGSPPMLGANGQGPHAASRGGKNLFRGRPKKTQGRNNNSKKNNGNTETQKGAAPITNSNNSNSKRNNAPNNQS